MVNPMRLELDGYAEADQVTPLERLRARLTTWAAFALLLSFLVVTIALWGYAAWWAVMKLVGLFT